MQPGRKPLIELAVVLALTAVVVLTSGRWTSRYNPPPAPSGTSPAAVPSPGTSHLTLDGLRLGQPGTSSATVDVDSMGRIMQITGTRLERGGQLLVEKGSSKDDVRQALGRPVGMTSAENPRGGRFWGYWTRGLDDPHMGILLEFEGERVVQIRMHRDWSVLSGIMLKESMSH